MKELSRIPGIIKRRISLWAVTSLAVSGVIFFVGAARGVAHRQATVSVSLSFEGVESGIDPAGNKFDINDLRSVENIDGSLEALGLEADAQDINSSVYITGNIPSDVIDRITAYADIYTSDKVEQAQSIRDTAYYPTQYTVTMDCFRLDLSYSDCTALLTEMAEKYKEGFLKKYGYKSSIENMLTSVDYSKHDYADAVDIIDSGLMSLENYVKELNSGDEVRFRSEKSGYTFSDLSKSIETIRTEDLQLISAQIIEKNITKDPDSLLAGYQLKLEKLELEKKALQDRIRSIDETLMVYQGDTVMMFGSSSEDNIAAEFRTTSDSYKKLIDRKVSAQRALSETMKKMEKYSERVRTVKSSDAPGDTQAVEQQLEKLRKKTDKLMTDIRVTVDDYYETVVLADACRVSPGDGGTILSVILRSLRDSLIGVLSALLIITGVFLLVCSAEALSKEPGRLSGAMDMITLGKKARRACKND